MNSEINRDTIARRLIEAAKVERCLPAGLLAPAGMRSFWPDIALDEDEIEEARRQRLADLVSGKISPAAPSASPEQIIAYEQATDWRRLHVQRDVDRAALGAWALCKASHRKFSGWCSHHGVVYRTGQRRVARAIDDIVAALTHKRHLRCENGRFDMSSNSPVSATFSAMMEEPRHEGAVTAWRAPGAVPQHLEGQEAAKERARSIARSMRRARAFQAKMKAAQEAKAKAA